MSLDEAGTCWTFIPLQLPIHPTTIRSRVAILVFQLKFRSVKLNVFCDAYTCDAYTSGRNDPAQTQPNQ